MAIKYCNGLFWRFPWLCSHYIIDPVIYAAFQYLQLVLRVLGYQAQEIFNGFYHCIPHRDIKFAKKMTILSFHFVSSVLSTQLSHFNSDPLWMWWFIFQLCKNIIKVQVAPYTLRAMKVSLPWENFNHKATKLKADELLPTSKLGIINTYQNYKLVQIVALNANVCQIYHVLLSMRKPIYGSHKQTIQSQMILILTNNTACGVFGHVSSRQSVINLLPCFTSIHLTIILYCDYTSLSVG